MLVCNNTTFSNCGESSIVRFTFERFFRDAEVVRCRVQCMRCFTHHAFRIGYDVLHAVMRKSIVYGFYSPSSEMGLVFGTDYQILSWDDHREERVRSALKDLSVQPCPTWFFVSPTARSFMNFLMSVGIGHDGFLLDKEAALRSVSL